MRSTVLQWTGIPVSVGIGPTKTLAKVANHLAKRDRAGPGVARIDATSRSDLTLSSVDIGDVWGIGWRWKRKLVEHGIRTALDMKQADERWLRRHLNIIGVRTARELRGVPAFQLDQEPAPKKSIVRSRSFARPIDDWDELSRALASFAARAAEKLRDQQSAAGVLTVYVSTNRFRPDEPRYANHATVRLLTPTNDTPTLVRHAREAGRRIWREGFRFKKAGVRCSALQPQRPTQLHLFDALDHERSDRIMDVMDRVTDHGLRHDPQRLHGHRHGLDHATGARVPPVHDPVARTPRSTERRRSTSEIASGVPVDPVDRRHPVPPHRSCCVRSVLVATVLTALAVVLGPATFPCRLIQQLAKVRVLAAGRLEIEYQVLHAQAQEVE